MGEFNKFLIDDLFEHVMLDHNGLLYAKPVFKLKARDALRDFFTRTRAWQFDVDPIPVKKSITEYDIDDNPGETTIVSIQNVKLYDVLLAPQQDYKMAQNNHSALVLDKNSRIPDHDDPVGLTLTLILKPTYTANNIESQIVDNWLEIICDGIRHYLFIMQKKSWSDPQLAVYYGQKFREGKNKVIAEMNRGVGTNGILTGKLIWNPTP